MKYVAGLLLIVFIAGCTNDVRTGTNDTDHTVSSTPALPYNISGAFGHDTSSFTEGLNFYNGDLLESTGNYGRSHLLLFNLKSGKVNKQVSLSPEYFGEGTVMLHDTIYQMTWKEKKVFVYNKDFKKIKELPLNYDGWGLTTNGKELIASDGSSNLYFYEPGTFRLLRMQGVTENGVPTANINELEYVNGFIYANQWQTNYIYKIDPGTGAIVGKMDLSELEQRAKAKYPGADVLNGIAYDPSSKKLYVTGKFWPEIYELSGNW
jgi:glutaminyl-peptide cyclotransferase